MRDLPISVDRVAAEATTKLVVKTALGHAGQRKRDHEERVDVGLGTVGAGAPVTQQAVECGRVGKLGCIADAAVFAIEAAGDLLPCGVERHRAEVSVARDGLQFPKHLGQLFTLAPNVVAMLLVEGGGAGQQVAKRGQAMTILRRKIGTAEERALVVGVDEHRQRPAARAVGE